MANEPRQCDGAGEGDGPCVGRVRRVRVIGPGGTDWGEFDYCAQAIAETRAKGFRVVTVALDRLQFAADLARAELPVTEGATKSGTVGCRLWHALHEIVEKVDRYIAEEAHDGE